VTTELAETSAPIIYGLALSTPVAVVNRLAAALTRYRERIRSPWRHYSPLDQAILTRAWLEGGHTHRSLGEGNGVPKTTRRTLIREGLKVLARRAPPLTEVIRLAVRAKWDYLIIDGVNIPTERVAAEYGKKQCWYSGKHIAPRGALSYTRFNREELEEIFLGLMPNLAPKG
jgi:hypothetical protein